MIPGCPPGISLLAVVRDIGLQLPLAQWPWRTSWNQA